MPDLVRITDVSPRDGLQNEPGVIATSDKVRLIELLCAANVDEVEVTSFVSPKWVPQLGDAAAVLAGAQAFRLASSHRVVFSALVPNDKGMDGVTLANTNANAGHSTRVIDKVSVFTAASETFARRNTNAGIDESIDRFVPVVTRAHEQGLRVRGYVSTIIACPFEGPIAPDSVLRVIDRLLALGVDEVDLGDTIGAATPETLGELLRRLIAAGRVAFAPDTFTLHLHDTRGLAGACAAEALRLGVRSFDSAVAGLGGCPYASTPTTRAPGNIDTALLLKVIGHAGLRTRVNAEALHAAGAFASRVVGEARARSLAQASRTAEPA